MECPVCGGDGQSMGTMGWMEHYRCQDCGAVFSVKIEKPTPKPDKKPERARHEQSFEMGGR